MAAPLLRVLALCTALAQSACGGPIYLAHLGMGQLRLLLDRELLEPELIARLSDDERAAVAVLTRARAHGSSLGLDGGTSYRHLLDRGDAPTLTVVVAAPPDRIEPRTWRFPLVGIVPYRSYFDPAKARAFADTLESEGLDTHLRPAAMYSTLGWFDDPIPRSVLHYRPFDLMDLVLHEQVHATVFVPGEVDYNEALATFVGQRATLELLDGDPELRAAAERAFADRARFAGLITDLAAELDGRYAETADWDEARAVRAEVVARYQRDVFPGLGWETRRYDHFPEADVNNAYVVSYRTYLGDLPCFERELDQLGGDLSAFIARHREEPGHRLEGCGG